jgi:hypothetical protein
MFVRVFAQKTKEINFVFLSILFVVAGCSDGTGDPVEANPLGLPKVSSELYQDGSSVGDLHGKFKYDGNRLLEIYYNTTQKKVFTYTGDVITKMEHYQAGVIRFEHTYTYQDGKLIEYHNDDKLTGNADVITYTHNLDGTVSYVHANDFNGTPNWEKVGTLTFVNGNIVEDVAEFSFYNVTDEYNLLVNVLEYNDKANPYKNILGYSSLLNLKGVMGNENIISDYTYSTSYKNGVQYAEGVTGKEYEFAYDKKNRTIQIDRYSNEDGGGEVLYLDRIYKFEY